MTEGDPRGFIIGVLLNRLEGNAGQRREALRDVLGLTVPGLDDAGLQGIAAMVPELPRSLYEKWMGLFADRLLETLPKEQLVDMCRGTEESNATLALVYVMFMESARMEKVVASDLRGLGVAATPGQDQVTLVGAWLKRRMTAVEH